MNLTDLLPKEFYVSLEPEFTRGANQMRADCKRALQEYEEANREPMLDENGIWHDVIVLRGCDGGA